MFLFAAILFEDAIILGAENDTLLYSSDNTSPFSLPFSVLQRTVSIKSGLNTVMGVTFLLYNQTVLVLINTRGLNIFLSLSHGRNNLHFFIYYLTYPLLTFSRSLKYFK